MKKDTFYFPHDYNARNDKKMVKLRQKYKQTGVGVFWSLVEMLYEEGGKLSLQDVPVLAAELRTKKEVVDSVIREFGLFENDENFFWSESVKRRMDKRLEKSEKAKASASHRWQNANGMRTHSDGNANKGKERKGKEIKEKERVNGAHAPTLKSFKAWTEKEFIDDLSNFRETYPKDLLNEFFKYWSEKSATGRMKFQLEDTWETKKRLETWERNEVKFSK